MKRSSLPATGGNRWKHSKRELGSFATPVALVHSAFEYHSVFLLIGVSVAFVETCLIVDEYLEKPEVG